MFERVVAWFLPIILGEFVEEGFFNKENVQVGVWSGYLVLENLVLKKTLFDMFKLPLALCHGVIGRFELKIPWSNMTSEPIVVVIDRVHLVLEPKFEWDPNAGHMRAQAIKQAKLMATEVFSGNKSDDPFLLYKEFAKTWLFESMVLKFIESIQFHIREIHIRYEDRASCPTEFCVGLTVESIHIQSASADNETMKDKESKFYDIFPSNDEQTFQIQGNTSKKLVIVNHFSLYWNPLRDESVSVNANNNDVRNGGGFHTSNAIDICTCVYSNRSTQEMEYLLSKTITKRNHMISDRPKHHFVLHPMDVNTSITFALGSISEAVSIIK